MTTTVFLPAQAPVVGKMPLVTTARVLSAGFGDGYRQEAGDGLNGMARALDATWDLLLSADADDIEAFFVAQRGYLAFLWTPPGRSTQAQWTCKTWTRVNMELGIDTITAHLEQVYDL